MYYFISICYELPVPDIVPENNVRRDNAIRRDNNDF